jgi:hypothetical protein
MNAKFLCMTASLALVSVLPIHVQAQPAAAKGDGAVVRYDGQMLVRVALRDARDLLLLGQVAPDCWSHAASQLPEGSGAIGTLDYRMTPEALRVVRDAGMHAEVLIADLQKSVDEDNARLALQQGDFLDAAGVIDVIRGQREGGNGGGGNGGGGGTPRGWFDDYKSPEQVRAYADGLVAAHPTLVSIETAGHSLQGREIYVVRLKTGTESKPILLLNSVQHAREWITVMTSMYIADQLALGYGVDPRVTALLDEYEVAIIPIVNPDGYAYTWTNDRFWRKNRRPNAGGTFGVDNNRNWGFAWGSDNGSSGSGSSETFRGTAPFSEHENIALRDWTLDNPGVVLNLDIHSAAQMILYPWGYKPQSMTMVDGIRNLSLGMRSAILASSGATYKAGQAYQTLYSMSGCSIDWFYGELGIYTWTVEVRGPGFNPPPTVILPTAREIHQALLWLGENLCLTDFDQTGFVDTDDFDAFTRAFEQGQMRADFDRSGFVDTDDFDAFVAAFEEGC